MTTAIAQAVTSSIPAFAVGQVTTCQFGNPTDTNWAAEKNGNVSVEILAVQICDITRRPLFLVKQVGQDLVGRATISRYNPNDLYDEPKLGLLYCTSARNYGSRAQTWTGIQTLDDAKASLGF